ncbi:MAG: helix-turn-helix domain-containing protein [Propionibacteriaceae bacterium]|jgi:ribosome-binding protein aMBF1 (putative translation factor)|nr:helix-turn-helix domain-containing protein [Propionibacteriaceae bacterium]
MSDDDVTWDEIQAREWAEMTDQERTEYVRDLPAAKARGDLAELVYHMRTDNGLTQTELARRMGSTQEYVSSVERGVRTPTLDTLQRMAAAVGLELKLSLVPATS